jgi:Flp pilus assembly protein TadG
MPFAGFLADRRGSAVPFFALVVVPVIGMAGAAVDYSRANSVRTAMQAAADASALILSKEAQSLDAAQMTQKATDYFNANFHRTDAKNIVVTATFSSPQEGSFILNVTASASVDAAFGKILDVTDFNMSAKSEVKWGVKRLELALVLDNTGSMNSSGKLAALKTAAHNLIDTLKVAAKKDGDVKIAIIPFDTMVKIGPSYAAEPWINFTTFGVDPATWTGCVTDRTQSHDVQDTTPSVANAATLFPARTCGALTPAMPLSWDWTALHAKIDQMTAAGNTNITIGLAWGWHALTANLPLTQAEAPSPELDKVIVLLTDGQNTQNRWTTSTSSIDARTQAACANIKAAAIRIYTVRVIAGNATLLQNCASNPTMYYDVQQASQLNGVFTSIAQNLANLRIAK